MANLSSASSKPQPPIGKEYSTLGFLMKFAIVGILCGIASFIMGVQDDGNLSHMAVGLVMIASALLDAVLLRRLSKKIELLSDLAYRASNGDLSYRAVLFNEPGILGRLVSNINHTMDLAEAYSKESEAAMNAAYNRQFYRQVITTGMRGNYTNYANAINRTLEVLKHRDNAFEEFIRFVSTNIKSMVETVAASSDTLNRNASDMSGYVANTSRQATTAANEVNLASQNVQAVAAAVEEFTASINEIAGQIGKVASGADEAVHAVEQTSQTIQNLDDAARKIGSIVDLINEIASQTNLLALNATIEAARAGEAGKGFAVVAGEVKNLASQTSKATEDIVQQIQSMQAVVSEVSHAIKDISSKVQMIGHSSSAVAGAVDEQRSVSLEISNNINSVSRATMVVNDAVNSVTATAQQSDTVTHLVSTAAADLSAQAETLRLDIDQFLTKIKAS